MASVDIVIPVYNEERVLADSIRTLRSFLAEHRRYVWRIVIADNASKDATQQVGEQLAADYADVHYLRLDQKGRGRALRRAWLTSNADVLAYMDVDLSTNLNALIPLIDSIVVDGHVIATGSRLMRASRITRSFKREFISRCYNVMVKALFWNRFSDAQCGFKAITRTAAAELVPRVVDQTWFFDTELLLLAERSGYRVAEVPVEWIEDLDSRVNIAKTAIDDIRGLLRVRFS